MAKILNLLEVKTQRQAVLWTIYASLLISFATLGLVHIIFGYLYPNAVYPTLAEVKLITFPLSLGICLPNFFGMFCMALRVTRKNEELLQWANRDPLTGIFNRRAFAERFQAQARKARRNNLSGVLMVADADKFKNINDTHGHGTGDHVLINLANQLTSLAGPDRCVARLGGEEFAILAFGLSQEEGHALAELLRKGVERSVLKAGKNTIKTTISIGYCIIGAESLLTEALGRADAALYTAKRSGRNKVVGFDHNAPTLQPDGDDFAQLGAKIELSQAASSN